MSKQMIYNFTMEEMKMNKRMGYDLVARLRMVTAVFLMVLLGGFFAGAVSSVNAQTVKKETASFEGGQKEGIKVHGNWTIEVRNPDGTLVTHREFENALDGGNRLLAGILGRGMVTGGWMVMLGSIAVGTAPCRQTPLPGSEKTPCFVVEPSSLSSYDAYFKTLKVNPAGSDPNVLVLTGTATAPNNGGGSIDLVQTRLAVCAADPLPANCLETQPDAYRGFTSKTITPIGVAAGQIIQVTVVISFS